MDFFHFMKSITREDLYPNSQINFHFYMSMFPTCFYAVGIYEKMGANPRARATVGGGLVLQEGGKASKSNAAGSPSPLHADPGACLESVPLSSGKFLECQAPLGHS